MRNDGILYTGQSSASRRKQKLELAKRDKADKKAKIEPNAQAFIDLIDTEQQNTLKAMLSLVNPSTPEEDVKSMLSALNLYKQSLSNLKDKTKAVVRNMEKEYAKN